ncbi:hypothetical protein MKZ38_005467 [Zalerion maritima]|uniref:Uncharacterized protein n=1 Tax=Zalerion maritima TaxID=339359 RepID=A0AAD5RK16_9PEZI|nr:hypothetical protein MKZ38_005467 [Zalerion maritima]
MSAAEPPPAMTPLGPWEQIIPRNYIRILFIFPLTDSLNPVIRNEVKSHFRASLDRLISARPDYFYKLSHEEEPVSPFVTPCVSRYKPAQSRGERSQYSHKPTATPDNWDDNHTILQEEVWNGTHSASIHGETGPLELKNENESLGYKELEGKRFPQQDLMQGYRYFLCWDTEHFKEVRMDLGRFKLPVSWVKLHFIKDGLMVQLNTHHVTGAGEMQAQFYTAFAAATRGDPIRCVPSPSSFDLPRELKDLPQQLTGQSFRQLLSQCPEWMDLPMKNGPTQPDKKSPTFGTEPQYTLACKIFRFDTQKLGQLRNHIAALQPTRMDGSKQIPSVNSVVCALAFAHVVCARLSAERDDIAEARRMGGKATLVMPVSFRSRPDFRESMKDYVGTAVCLSQVKTDLQLALLAAAQEEYPALAKLVNTVEECVNQVDLNYVQIRTACIQKANDPRRIGVSYHPDRPTDFQFNTWRQFGGDLMFKLRSDSGRQERLNSGGNSKDSAAVKPAAVRRAMESSHVGALVMPGGKDDPYELLLTLPDKSMDMLMTNNTFMSYCEAI